MVLDLGWRGNLSQSTRTDRGGTRGGVGVLWRPWITVEAQDEVIAGHAFAITMRSSKLGSITCMSVYGWPFSNDQKKAIIWKSISEYLAARGLPYLIGGDFNETEGEISKRTMDSGMPARTEMPSNPTRMSKRKDDQDTSRCIDGFVLSRKLTAWEHSKAFLALQGRTSPHAAVKIQLNKLNERTWISFHERPAATEPTSDVNECMHNDKV